jgi:hypothetical protein
MEAHRYAGHTHLRGEAIEPIAVAPREHDIMAALRRDDAFRTLAGVNPQLLEPMQLFHQKVIRLKLACLSRLGTQAGSISNSDQEAP